MRVRFLFCAFFAGAFALSGNASAADSPPVLVLHNNQFEPRELALPEGVKTKLIVRNLDNMPAEFESFDLSREVVIAGHGEATIYVGPLEAGNYKFFNDFNPAMQGAITVTRMIRKED